MSGFISRFGAIGKIAGAVNKITSMISDAKQREAGRNHERAEIATQESENDEKIRNIRNSIRNSDDADSVLYNFLGKK